VSLGRRILRSVSLLTLRLAGMVMLAAGAASLALRFSVEVLAGASSEAWVNLVRVFASKLGITFLLTGSAAFVLLMLPGWFAFDRKGSSDTEAEEEIGGWLIFLALSLVALPLVALAVASPLISLAISPERYQAHIDEVPVCDFIWRRKLLGRDHVEISFAEESDRTLDKRLGLAFGVLLEKHVRSRNYN
jgi:hypothetical protein